MQYELTRYLIQGLTLGATQPAVLGPLGLLCIYRVLINGRLSGAATALGALTADLIYGAFAAFGAAGLSALVLAAKIPLAVLGGGFMIWTGVEAYKVDSMDKETLKKSDVPIIDYATAIFLGLTAALRVALFQMTAHHLDLPDANGQDAAGAAFLAGLILGGAAIWLVVVLLAGLAHDQIKPRSIFDVSKWSGIVLGLFGLYVIAMPLIFRM